MDTGFVQCTDFDGGMSITSAKKDVQSSLFVCLSVCLFVGNFAQKTSKRICMKFSGKVGNGPMIEQMFKI